MEFPPEIMPAVGGPVRWAAPAGGPCRTFHCNTFKCKTEQAQQLELYRDRSRPVMLMEINTTNIEPLDALLVEAEMLP